MTNHDDSSAASGPLWEAFAFEARRLREDFERASTLGRGSAQEVADHREGAFRRLIERFLPFKQQVVKGQVLGSDGTRSASIDCVVLNVAHPQMVHADGKFSLILADGVDYAVEVKGRLDRAELVRLLEQCRSLRRVLRTETAVAFPARHPELVEPSRRIPFFAYVHEMTMSPETLASQIRDWAEDTGATELERPEMIVVRDQGVYHDLSSPASAMARRALEQTPERWELLRSQQLWSDTGELALGAGVLVMNEVMPAVPAIQRPPIIHNYRSGFSPPLRPVGRFRDV